MITIDAIDEPLIAIDPGTHKSACLAFDGKQVSDPWIVDNERLMELARFEWKGRRVSIEMIACYGMAVGKEVFETCLLIGRLQEALGNDYLTRLVYRRDVKLHLCGTARAKDPNVRQALIDKYGAPGTKKQPGPTYGVTSHLWSALAIADYSICQQWSQE